MKIFALIYLLLSLFHNQAHAQPLASRGKVFNPDIGVNFLGLFQRGTALSDDRTVVPHNGLSLQESEFQFSADVDPYLKAIALFAVRQESGDTGFVIDPEEIFLETTSLQRVTLKAGKFKTSMDRHNRLHTHAFPFIDAPLISSTLLGDEGLNEVGVSASILIPVNWFFEVTFQGISLANENLYQSTRSGSPGGLLNIKNLVDLNDDLTFEITQFATIGKNQFDITSHVLGTDFTFKWRPSEGGKYKSLAWTTEYMKGYRPGLTDSVTGIETEHLGGVSSWLQYQFAERWWIQGRYEFMGLPRSEAIPLQNKQSVLLGFFPSEFSGIRLQYDHLVTEYRAIQDHAVSLQYNISIGAHPAHTY